MFSGFNMTIHQLKNDKLWNGMPKTERLELLEISGRLYEFPKHILSSMLNVILISLKQTTCTGM